MKRLLTLCLACLLTACATNFTSLQPEGITQQHILNVPEEQAFKIAFSAFNSVLPGYEITEIDGPTKGYRANFRFLLDTYTQQVMVIPATGTDSNGERISGYYYEVSGSGSSIVQGRAKNVQLFDTVMAASRSTGKFVPVTKVSKGSYAGAPWKQGNENRSSAAATHGSSGPDALTQIERLQQLRDKGAITEEEFQQKKKELLGRI